MSTSLIEKAWPRSLRLMAAVLFATLLSVHAQTARAQNWQLHDIIEPPILPDVDPADRMAFGASVSVGSHPWLVVGAPKADCPDPAGAGTIPDTGRIFIYKRVLGVWQYHQSFCASSPKQNGSFGASVDVSESWMIVGAYGASTGMRGVVELFYLDPTTKQWTRRHTTTGVVGGFLGSSVSIDRGLAVASESGYDTYRGRIHSWKLAGNTITSHPPYAPTGLDEFERFGSGVKVYSDGCELPNCTSYTDVAVTRSSSKLYILKKKTTGWLAAQVISPPTGAAFSGGLDVGRTQVVTGLNVENPSPYILPCPVGRAARVYYRSGGSFAAVGSACPPAGALPTFAGPIEVNRGSSEFYVGSPDSYGALASQPYPDPASVFTFAGYPAITYVDSVQEVSLAPTGPEQSEVYNDSYGSSISVNSSYMAVGAPWIHIWMGYHGRGHVVVYWNCC